MGGSVRRLWALVNNLPPEAATLRGDSSWTNADELAALTLEAVNHWGFLTTWFLTNGKGKLPPPSRFIEHPDRPVPKPKRASKEQILKFFGRLKGGES